MTPEEADKAQNWLGMDGATAWHLIDRHADNWNEVGELMNSWLRANVLAEREACAKAAEGFTDYRDDRKWEKDGHTNYTTEIVADTMKMLGSRQGGTDAPPPERSEGIASPAPASQAPGGFNDFEDDIPFLKWRGK